MERLINLGFTHHEDEHWDYYVKFYGGFEVCVFRTQRSKNSYAVSVASIDGNPDGREVILKYAVDYQWVENLTRLFDDTL